MNKTEQLFQSHNFITDIMNCLNSTVRDVLIFTATVYCIDKVMYRMHFEVHSLIADHQHLLSVL